MGSLFSWTVSMRAVFLGFCLSFIGMAAHAQDKTVEPYVIHPGDTLVVNVLEDPQLDAQVLVLPDGRISLPVAGTLTAAGLTPQQLSSTVKSRLRGNFVQPPDVTVTVSALAEQSAADEQLLEVYVLGEVARPGRYAYKTDETITVAKALSLAGGLGPFAARERIQVRELVEDAEVMRLFNYKAFEKGMISNSRDLAALSDGAVVVVPERGLFE